MALSSVLDQLREAVVGTEWETTLCAVGGVVRDSLLGREATGDIDLVTEASAPGLAEWLFARGISEIPPVTYARFGTAMLRIGGVAVELVTARRESYDADSRKPFTEPATLTEDALRRDFTVNALYRRLHDNALLDLTGHGLDDLEARILRTPRDPFETFQDDPLRMLRAVRFRGKLGFEPAPGLYEAICKSAGRLGIVSAERIRDEFMLILGLPDPSGALQELMDLGLFDQFAPELRAMDGVEQGKYHFADVWRHSLAVVTGLPPEPPLLRLAGLLHDVGKPSTHFVDANGDHRFFGHETVGEAIARGWMRRMKFSDHDTDLVASLVKNHMRLGSSPKLSPSAVRRLIRDMGDELEPLLTLVEADANALRKGVKRLDMGLIRGQIAAVSAVTPRASLASPLDGREIMQALGLGPGVEVREWKRLLTEEVLEGRLAAGEKDAAREWLLYQAEPKR